MRSQLAVKFRALLPPYHALSLSNWTEQYTLSQRFYFAATLSLLIATFASSNAFLYLAGSLAFVGLVRELLKLFQKVWDSTLGKSFILILYASTANLALAFAAMKINHITGVEPSPFTFTLGFTSLVLLPFWIALSHIVIFLLVLIVANLWLLLSIPLNLIGISLRVHWEDSKHAIITMILRIILIPIVLMGLVNILFPYIASPDMQNGMTINLNANEQEGLKLTINDEVLDNDAAQQELTDILAKANVIDKTIAHFIYYLEAYPNSMCHKGENERSVLLDQYSALFIRQDSDSNVGYQYRVAACQARYSE